MECRKIIRLVLLSGFAAAPGLSGCGGKTTDALPVVRMGYFANITHAQAIIGIARGDFQKALGSVRLETMRFNAGPSVIEAIFAGQLDCSFIGPSPAINGYAKSGGRALRVVCGVAANGVVVVARPGSGISKLEDLAGKKIATPQYGNTQDVSARIYTQETLGLKIGENAGDTRIIPIANADQLEVFRRGDIDASWVPEPWGARLVNETGASVIAEEKDLWPGGRFAVTVFAVSTAFLEKHPKEVESLVRTIDEITGWVNAHREEEAELVNGQLEAMVGKPLAPAVLAAAFGRVEFTTDPLASTIETFARQSVRLGMLKEVPDMQVLVDRRILDRIKTGDSRER